MSNFKNRTGSSFGRLLVIRRGVNTRHGAATWVCKCNCGNEVEIVSSSLINGISTSCGCYRQEVSAVSGKKLGESQCGDKSPSWKGGITSESEKVRKSKEYKVWRLSIFTRDNFICQRCNKKRGGDLNAHHIRAFNRYPEDRLLEENGITFCTDCHTEFHDIYGRTSFTPYDTIEYLKEGGLS